MAKTEVKRKFSSFSLMWKLYPILCREDKDVIEPTKTIHKVCHRSLNQIVLGATELPRGNSSRNIVEMIFKSSRLKSKMEHLKVERVVKINHREDVQYRFEEYREMAKRKAGKECSRCMADGNEMLRFHGTSSMCSLNVINGVVELCSLKGCNVCNILRTAFYYNSITSLSVLYTAASSRLAHDSFHDEGGALKERVMLVCRVIAGHLHCIIEEAAYYSNARAFLPCFLIVYSLRE